VENKKAHFHTKYTFLHAPHASQDGSEELIAIKLGKKFFLMLEKPCSLATAKETSKGGYTE
jgi:hypothetical protein